MIKRKTIPREKLTIDTAQSRDPGWDGDEQDERLKESIKNTGILSALLVRPIESTSYEPQSDAEYAIIAGSRRYRAGRKAGKQEFPCKVIEADDLEAAILSYKENEERKDLTTAEKARSIKLQYEAMKPLPPEDGQWECPIDRCKSVCDTSQGLEMHIQQTHLDDSEIFNPEGEMYVNAQIHSAPTNQQAHKKLAKKHFPDLFSAKSTAGVEKIRKLIAVAELPSDVSALYKDPEDRTDDEKRKMDQKGIPSDRVLSDRFVSESASSRILNLHDELESVDGVDAADHVLETVGKLDAGQEDSQLGSRISDVTEDIIDKVSDSESVQKNNEIINDTLERHEERLIEQTDAIKGPLMRKLSFTFDNNKYSLYHARAREQMKAESNAEAVRKVYQEYLEEQAEENDW
jgi:hypothetical protein